MTTDLLESNPSSARKSARGEPTWEIAQFYPRQGEWTEAEFLTISTNHFVELNDGCVEVLPMPSALHQAIVAFLYRLMNDFVARQRSGTVLFAPLPVRLWPGQYREPDIIFLKPERMRKLQAVGLQGQPEGADLVVEVVSPGHESRNRDLVEKRDVYARAGIAEYWIVDPETRSITVLVLNGAEYRVHGEFAADSMATSVLLTGFDVAVRDVFAVAEAIE